MTRTAAARLLAFGFMLTLLSSFGQTFFIGLFSEALQGAAALGDGTFGTLYSGATLASAGCVFWAGALIDRVALRAYVSGVVLLLAAGCVIVGLAEHIALLGVALFLLRFAGQGLLTHTAVTTLARSFTKRRGKALSVALLGHPAGEAALPLAAVALAGALGWRSVWLLAAGVVLAAIPVLLWLCGRPSEQAPGVAAAAAGGAGRAGGGVGAGGAGTGGTGAGGSGAGGADGTRGAVGHGAADDADSTGDASRREVLRDRAFHLLLPTLLLPGFVATGVFIHQARLVAEKDWTLAWFAASFMAFAAAQVAGMLGSGPLIDRLSARRLAPFYLLPLGAACVAAGLLDHRLIAPVFMAGAGFTNGAAASIGTALWAELYGITHLGAIRALAASTMVLSTALAPALFGWLLEGGVRFGSLLLGCAAAVGGAAVLARMAVGLRLRCRT